MSDRMSVEGSEKRPIVGSRVIGPVDPNVHVELTVILKRKGDHKEIAAIAASDAVEERKHLSREEYAQQFGASMDDVIKIENFARTHHLHVDRIHTESRSIALSGKAHDVARAFGTELKQYEHPAGGTFRGRTGAVSVPSDIAEIIQAVVGLDDRPTARSKHRRLEARSLPSALLPTEVAQLYAFPQNRGANQTIAIIELGGGFRHSELRTYFTEVLKLARVPTVVSVSVDHGNNRPGVDPGSDGEVLLDIEVAGAVAPEATIVVYFAPNTDRGFLDAINAAVHDRHHRPSVISISWGASESNWTEQALTVFSEAFEAATALGVTVCAAAGDAGSTDGLMDGLQHTDYPASDPNVLACGGTRLVRGESGPSESVWNNGPENATGGGISAHFPRPTWQREIRVPNANPGGPDGRGVPDVAGNADPVTGYKVLVDGDYASIGGTSAVAPLWAGLIALLNEIRKVNVGLLQPLIYANRAALRDVNKGNNGAYFAIVDAWDACTGLGTPNGAALAELIRR